MNSLQAQAENDGRSYFAEDEMTESERREWEEYLDSLYWGAKMLAFESGVDDAAF